MSEIPMESLYYIYFLLLAQGPMGGGGSAAAETAQAAAENAGGSGSFLDFNFFWIMMAVMMLMFLFIMPRQQQKDEAKRSELLDGLKKNDEVVTAGGIRGKVVNIRDGGEFITIRIDENTNTKMQVLKKSVTTVLSAEEKKSD